MGFQIDSNKKEYISPEGYKRCYKCGQWHNAQFIRCAPCNGLSERHTPIGQDQDGYKYNLDEIPPK